MVVNCNSSCTYHRNNNSSSSTCVPSKLSKTTQVMQSRGKVALPSYDVVPLARLGQTENTFFIQYPQKYIHTLYYWMVLRSDQLYRVRHVLLNKQCVACRLWYDCNCIPINFSMGNNTPLENTPISATNCNQKLIVASKTHVSNMGGMAGA